MIFWIGGVGVLLLMLGIATSLGNASADKKLGLKAAALQEKAKREFTTYAVTSIGPSEFFLLYKKAEAKRRLPEKLGVLFGLVIVPSIAMLMFPVIVTGESLFLISLPALVIAGVIVFGIIGAFIANSKGELWTLNKMEDLHNK
ncbi:MAG: hypothetical protein U5K36_15200 [Roseovarius sp.]|nr:hypothetical protein [Roseovarius sp.]